MRPRLWWVGMGAGVVGLAATIPQMLPSLAESLLLGTSIGLILASPLGELVPAAPAPDESRRVTRMDEAARDAALSEPDPVVRMEKLVQIDETKLRRIVKVRNRKVSAEHEKILDDFDALLSHVETIDDPLVNERVTHNFEHFVDRLTKHYPEWDAEGRMRTYVLLKKIADSLNLNNADDYLDMAYKTLMTRGQEATEMSHLTLNGKVERIYRDPESESAHHLAGTLMLMNRGDDEYAKEMTVEAIHLWSDTRFEKLKQDFAIVPSLGKEEEGAVLDLLEKEMEKARRAKEPVAATRARELWMMILVSGQASRHR